MIKKIENNEIHTIDEEIDAWRSMMGLPPQPLGRPPEGAPKFIWAISSFGWAVVGFVLGLLAASLG